jgi:hypothetical protein
LLASLVDEPERRLEQTNDVLSLCITAGQVFIGELAGVTWRQLDTCLQDVRDACSPQGCQVLLNVSASDEKVTAKLAEGFWAACVKLLKLLS